MEEKDDIYILFRQSGYWIAFSSEIMVEIVKYPKVSHGHSDKITLRGEQIDIYYFYKVLGDDSDKKLLSQSNILILQDKYGKIGLVVDYVEEIISLRKLSIYPIIPLILKRNRDLFLGVTLIKGRVVTILDQMILYNKCTRKGSGISKEVINGA